MALAPSNAPAAAVAAIHRALARRATRSEFTSSSLVRANIHSLSLSMPHRLAYLHLDDIRRGADLRKVAEVRSWRFLVHERQSAVAKDGIASDMEEHVPIAAATAAATGAKEGAEEYHLGELNEGPFVEGTEKAIRAAEELEEVRKGHFEVFLLIVPAVYVAALWLQNHDDGADIILTIPPSNPALVAYRPMTPKAFLEILHGLAQKLR
jgi:hypothetical protein